MLILIFYLLLQHPLLTTGLHPPSPQSLLGGHLHSPLFAPQTHCFFSPQLVPHTGHDVEPSGHCVPHLGHVHVFFSLSPQHIIASPYKGYPDYNFDYFTIFFL